MGGKSSESYKREAVAKAEASGNVSQTARELGISPLLPDQNQLDS
jgi:transposase-like protein